MLPERVIETDVLVIGGGMAGLTAAIKARDRGLEVLLVDKGYAGKSGSTPYAFWMSVFCPEWGHDMEAWTGYVSAMGEYLNNRTWTEIVFAESYARYRDLVDWGVEFLRDGAGELRRFRFPGIATESLQLKKRVFGATIRRQAVRAGVRILDRTMITDLLQQEGRIVGAVGLPVDSPGPILFNARAVVLCAGGSSFKPDGWPVSGLTGDGEAMAYRAGAEISGKEFNEPKSTSAFYPAATMGLTLWRAERNGVSLEDHSPPQVHRVKCVNALGEEVLGLVGANSLELEFEAHAGRAPVYQDMGPGAGVPAGAEPAPGAGLTARIGGAAAGLSVHTAEGLWPTDSHGASTLPGLFAAGDACSTMQVGAVYPGVGYALCGAAVTGARAGAAAAEYARQVDRPPLPGEEVERQVQSLLAPLQRRGGFGPRWVTQVLRNTVLPYFILYVKHADRLQAALTLVEFLRDHMAPRLVARDPHELRLAVEAVNLIHNAEMKLRASLFREESRGTHYREDFPRRRDPEWLVWVTLKQEQGVPRLSRRPIPREWWPDLALPYEQRYPKRLPGE